jgi:hypothetical protein
MRRGKSDYEILVDRRGRITAKHILVADLDIWDTKSSVALHIEEYASNKAYDYGFGFMGGTSSNLSPCLRLSQNVETKKLEKDIGTKILLMLKNTNAPLLMALKNWLDIRKSDFADATVSFISLLDLPKRESPRALVLRFPAKKGGILQFSGEYDEVREFMVERERVYSSPKEGCRGVCHACGKEGLLRVPFSYGLMTLDQASFSLGFLDKSKQTQFMICDKCYIDCINGYNVIEAQLKFRAYSMKEGRVPVPVYYYLIPQTPDRKQLRNAVKTIGKAKRAIIDGAKRDFEREIRTINSRIQRADRVERRSLEQKLKKIQKRNDYLTQTDDKEIDVPEMIERVFQSGLGLIVFYFRLTNQPGEKPKEVIGHFYISGSHLRSLAELFSGLRQDYSRKEIQLWRLRSLTDDKMFMKILEALFGQSEINYQAFLKKASRKIEQDFKKGSVKNPDGNFPLWSVRNFMMFDDMLHRAGLAGV